MSLFSSLNREQKESIGLLQIGTFLEYFDLMLYVHMAVLLNEIFFPQTDPHTASLLAAFALCSSLAFRPLGALLFGWIGDHIGRKSTIIITTSLMAVSCLVMANLPTYSQIGVSAAWIVTICRITQGISSMGEVIGAEIYLTESIRRPIRFPVVTLLNVADNIGGIAALGVALLVISCGMNWRVAFWIGAVIAIFSAFARTRLRETPEFIALQKQKLKESVQKINVENDPVQGKKFNATWRERINYKTLMSYFFISSVVPLGFYLAFFHFIPFLKVNFGYSSEDVIRHNFFLSLVPLVNSTILSIMSYRFHPLRIQRVRATLVVLSVVLFPFLCTAVTTPTQLFILQAFLLIASSGEAPSIPIYWSHFPVYCRFTCATLLFSTARGFMHIITSFGVIYLISYFGYFGIWVIGLPMTVAYFYGINHFVSLEKKYKLYPNLS